ncbi:VOC family protein [Catalinimonas niigatensis]|uniref:VOC family protein n=1 Tax=Catalinimonas niigatensis TaxID=1397264 RepID=UPI0026668BFA|nr:VOC family protein [Catalinimonas niigatensis]WPP51459.1 VOC family protein [Catalinimonas niigatensis]
MNIPQGHQRIMPYLMIQDAAKFIDFTQKVFAASLSFKRMREDEKTIMHAEIMIGESTIMLAEISEAWSKATANLFVYVADADEAYRKALEAGATEVMELRDQDYGRSGGVADPFGNIWWITAVS